MVDEVVEILVKKTGLVLAKIPFVRVKKVIPLRYKYISVYSMINR